MKHSIFTLSLLFALLLPLAGQNQSSRADRSSQHLTPEQMAAIVLIKTRDGQGTGFMARVNDVPFVITNLHVVADPTDLRVTTSNGRSVPVQAAFAAKGHDIALLRVEDAPATLIMAADVVDSRIGDEIAVVGNRLGGGVLTQEVGQIVGIGPDRIEVDAAFQPGNSGSPIINLRTGEVIGIATYLQNVSVIGGDRRAARNEDEKIDRELTTRWFGFRFDSVRQWERIDWVEWQRQSELLRRYQENSEVLLSLLRGERHLYLKNPAMRSIVQRFERDVSGKTSADFRTRRSRELIVDLVNFSRLDKATLEGRFYDHFETSAYFDSSIRLQKEFRQHLTNYLEERERDVRGFMLSGR